MRFASQFAARLHDYRQAAGLTESELGERLSVHQVTVSRWEKGTREPSFAQMEGIAEALGVQVWRFFAPAPVIKLVDWAESHLSFLTASEAQELRATGTDGMPVNQPSGKRGEENHDARDNVKDIWSRIRRPRIISLPKWRQSATLSNRSQSAPKLGASRVPIDFQTAHNRPHSASEVG